MSLSDDRAGTVAATQGGAGRCGCISSVETITRVARHSLTVAPLLLPLFLMLTLSACGGGGEEDPPPSPTPTSTNVPTPTLTPAITGSGLVASITTAAIDAGGRVTTTFTLTSAQGVAVRPTLSSTDNPQEARVRFSLAHFESYSGGGDLANEFIRSVNLINRTRPAYDSGGMLETIDPILGQYRYTFGTILPQGFSPAFTYTIAIQADREVAGTTFSSNPVFDFVPSGGAPQIRAGSTTQQCNQCHGLLTAHGSRHEVRLCQTCHSDDAVDEKGRSIDFRVMIHKIHAGKDLPSVANGPPGSTYAIYSSRAEEDVVFAEKGDDGTITGIGFPRALQNCSACHSEGATADFHLQKPSAPACATCHDDVNPSQVSTAAGAPGSGHGPGSFPDGQCAACHKAESGEDFDLTVPGAHVVPARASALEGLHVAITGVTNTIPGASPVISFRVTDDDGVVQTNLSSLNRLGFTIAGPTADYSSLITPVAVGGGASGMLSAPSSDGTFQYTPSTVLPATAVGTWAVGVEARRQVTIESMAIQEAAENSVVTFSVDGSMPLARRTVVDDNKCSTCHGTFSKDFSVHGNLRNSTEYCVLCHNPNASDAGRRSRDPVAVANGDANETIDFKVMIHKIHRGEHLEQQPYLIYGFGPAPQNFTAIDLGEVLFPRDLRDCDTCHVNDSNLLPPFPGDALPVRQTHLDPATGAVVIDGHLGPVTAVCTSCHDGDDAQAHAQTQTAPDGGEACTVCHGEGRTFAASGFHAP